jgi:hypothetical protein
MTKNLGRIDRTVRGLVALVALVVAVAVGLGTVTGVILALLAVVMAVTAVAGFCPLYRLLGLSSERHTVAPR